MALEHNRTSKQNQAILEHIISVIIVITVTFWGINEYLHWSIVPTVACGVITLADAIKWFRLRIDAFDPTGLVGAVGFVFYFLGPLLNIKEDIWRTFHEPVDLDWIGYMSVINFTGLLLYKLLLSLLVRRPVVCRSGVRLPNWNKLHILFPILLLTTIVAQVAAVVHLGGISGYLAAYENRADGDDLVGMGWVFMVGESFPIILFMWITMWLQRRGSETTWFEIYALILFFFLLQMAFGGMRGSRSNTIWHLFWAAGIVHLTLRRLNRSQILASCAFCLAFMVIYGSYKQGGLEGLSSYLGGGYKQTVDGSNRRHSLMNVVVGDLSRSDPQARVLEGIYGDRRYELAYGATYLGAVSILIPRQVLPDRPHRKGFYGGQAMYGKSSGRRSSTPYGITGEAMLNFGVIGAALSFGAFALIVASIKNFVTSLHPWDIRILFAPFYINLTITLLCGDLDNTIFFFIKNGAVPLLIVLLGSTKVRITEDQ